MSEKDRITRVEVFWGGMLEKEFNLVLVEAPKHSSIRGRAVLSANLETRAAHLVASSR